MRSYNIICSLLIDAVDTLNYIVSNNMINEVERIQKEEVLE
jgi:hypothetical protein